MRRSLCALISGLLLVSWASAQQAQPQLKTIPDSINFIWKDIEQDFTSLAEAMPEDKWSFKPTQGEFKDVRTFGEQVKHVACANEAWAKQMAGEKPPSRCDIGESRQDENRNPVISPGFIQNDRQGYRGNERQEPIAPEHRPVLGFKPTLCPDRYRMAHLRSLRPTGGIPADERYRAARQPEIVRPRSLGSTRPTLIGPGY